MTWQPGAIEDWTRSVEDLTPGDRTLFVNREEGIELSLPDSS